MASEISDFNLARAHLSLNFRESKLFDVFFKLYSVKKRSGKVQKVTPSQACIVAQLNKNQFVIALESCIRMHVIRKINAKLVETIKDGNILHSIFKLESKVGCPILGVVYDKARNVFYCLDLDYKKWKLGRDLFVTTIMDKFSIKSPSKIKEEFDGNSSMMKKALGYYCTKYEAAYETKYRVNQGIFKMIRWILEQLELRSLDRMIIFKMIDDVFYRLKDKKWRATWKIISEDCNQFIENYIISLKTENKISQFYTDENGNVKIRS